jgi:hypothetical protein
VAARQVAYLVEVAADDAAARRAPRLTVASALLAVATAGFLPELSARAAAPQAHQLAVAAEHALIHAVPRLTAATVHTDHLTAPGLRDPHEPLAHHAPDG